MITGNATLSGTNNYHQRFHQTFPFVRENSFFSVSALGHGTYLGDATEEISLLYQSALEKSLKSGINFIDTASVYRHQRSERDIGKVLHKLLTEEQSLKREEIVIATKAGFVPADSEGELSPVEWLERLTKGEALKDEDINTLQMGESTILHSLHPVFLEYCLEQSRQNLGVETIDIFYLHNPEMAMMALGADAFFRQLEEVFTFLEEKVKEGKILSYGMATWQAFQISPRDNGYIPLEEVKNCARFVTENGNPAFKFIQLPYNQAMQEASRDKTQPCKNEMLTVFNAAKEMNINVTANIPLFQGKLIETTNKAPKLLRRLLDNHNLLSAMVGMKTPEHVQENISGVKE
jgi:aryl-alcohol dehydrogenase-like predicted oxidoreductase